MREQDKVLVVGGGAGIGKAVAEMLGERAVVWTRTGRAGLAVDAADGDAVRKAARQFLDEHGAPWGVVHAPGDFAEESLLATSRERFDALLRSNLVTAFEVVQAFAPAMVEAGRGRIVLFAAAGVDRARGMKRAPVYFAAKAAVVQIARSLAAEVAESTVTVNVVAPGLIEHDESHRESQQRLKPRVPAGRLGGVEDVTGVVRWLLSAESSYVTGEVFTVDGGLQT